MGKTECSTYFRPVLIAYSDVENTNYLFQPRCKMWSCPECATVNMYQWVARIGDGWAQYETLGVDGWRFVTITSNPKLKTKEQTMWVWPKAWSKFSTRMRRKYQGIKYVLLPELHKDGRLHVHMICSGGMTQKWLKQNTYPCGLGHQGKSKRVTDRRQTIYYTTKYLSKSLENSMWPYNFRRVRTSQHWPELQTEFEKLHPNLDWRYLTTYAADGLEYLAEGITAKTKVATKVI